MCCVVNVDDVLCNEAVTEEASLVVGDEIGGEGFKGDAEGVSNDAVEAVNDREGAHVLWGVDVAFLGVDEVGFFGQKNENGGVEVWGNVDVGVGEEGFDKIVDNGG